jgi:recombination protein RecA
VDFAQLVEKINKDYGETVISGKLPPRERIPFSSPYLNYITYGGIVYGSSSEFVGAESSGKSTLAQDLISQFQKIEKTRYETKKQELELALEKAKGKELERVKSSLEALRERKTVYLDLEFTLDGTWLNKLGVDPSKVFIIQPSAMGVETPLDWIIQLAETGEVGFIIIDSIGAMVSGAEEEKSLNDSTYGGISKALTRFYKKVMPHVKKNNIALLVINQTRDDMSNPYNQFNRPGGKMNKFAQSIALGLGGGDKLDEKYGDATGKSEMVYARITNVQMLKNKTAPPDRQRTKFTIKHGRGIDQAYDVFSMACDLGMVAVAGAYYTFFDPENGEELNKVQGKSKAVEFLRTNDDLRNKLWNRLYDESLLKEDYTEQIEEEE